MIAFPNIPLMLKVPMDILEADSLANTLKSDYGNFSDGLLSIRNNHILLLTAAPSLFH